MVLVISAPCAVLMRRFRADTDPSVENRQIPYEPVRLAKKPRPIYINYTHTILYIIFIYMCIVNTLCRMPHAYRAASTFHAKGTEGMGV